MVEARRGTILLTGATASLRGGAGFASFAIGKFGLRALGQSMAREFGPLGIHVAHVVIDGQIGQTSALGQPNADPAAPSALDPEALAQVYWDLHRQHPSTWTLELDLRPAAEKF
jgi:NAD(P)-dependent dehydrogenase (short-subunit alcohol dehydrogenase family)